MKAVVQRVASASVEVDGRTVSAIGPGLLVLVGVHDLDTHSDADYIKFDKWACVYWQVMQKNFEVLLVSQFTLYGILKGNKPDFHVAMGPDRAKSFYASLVERFQRSYKSEAVKDVALEEPCEEMEREEQVNLVNDGPVTMQLESPNSSRNTNGAAEEKTVNKE
ncbi:D-tyrosyl-tRNA(Tyr) deacylase [Artemisia annua]|uniref:D-aminoacyl-tRNA deacylase n=1 Tax=Artemisia annua TaxID=35608 RepID=A0A2U1KKM2_ARTAN|nr:D-tyrosyl-tRNA(Tyr) deacylase [Artemisia annua]